MILNFKKSLRREQLLIAVSLLIIFPMPSPVLATSPSETVAIPEDGSGPTTDDISSETTTDSEQATDASSLDTLMNDGGISPVQTDDSESAAGDSASDPAANSSETTNDQQNADDNQSTSDAPPTSGGKGTKEEPYWSTTGGGPTDTTKSFSSNWSHSQSDEDNSIDEGNSTYRSWSRELYDDGTTGEWILVAEEISSWHSDSTTTFDGNGGFDRISNSHYESSSYDPETKESKTSTDDSYSRYQTDKDGRVLHDESWSLHNNDNRTKSGYQIVRTFETDGNVTSEINSRWNGAGEKTTDTFSHIESLNGSGVKTTTDKNEHRDYVWDEDVKDYEITARNGNRITYESWDLYAAGDNIDTGSHQTSEKMEWADVNNAGSLKYILQFESKQQTRRIYAGTGASRYLQVSVDESWYKTDASDQTKSGYRNGTVTTSAKSETTNIHWNDGTQTTHFSSDESTGPNKMDTKIRSISIDKKHIWNLEEEKWKLTEIEGDESLTEDWDRSTPDTSDVGYHRVFFALKWTTPDENAVPLKYKTSERMDHEIKTTIKDPVGGPYTSYELSEHWRIFESKINNPQIADLFFPGDREEHKSGTRVEKSFLPPGISSEPASSVETRWNMGIKFIHTTSSVQGFSAQNTRYSVKKNVFETFKFAKSSDPWNNPNPWTLSERDTSEDKITVQKYTRQDGSSVDTLDRTETITKESGTPLTATTESYQFYRAIEKDGDGVIRKAASWNKNLVTGAVDNDGFDLAVIPPANILDNTYRLTGTRYNSAGGYGVTEPFTEESFENWSAGTSNSILTTIDYYWENWR